MEGKKLFVVTYAHFYDFEVYCEGKVYDNEAQAKERFNAYLHDVYEQCSIDDSFEIWAKANTRNNELNFDNDLDGCDIYNIYNVKMETTELNKD